MPRLDTQPLQRFQQHKMAYSTATIAAGCFGKVYKEKYNDTWAAIKKVPHHLITKHNLERECEVYNKANHPNIVKLLGNITLRDCKWIIPMEFIFGEDLETTIFKVSKSKIQLTPAIKGTIIIGMCEGLLHLHSKDVVHQDLKPENIMVEHGTHRAVIIDLGLAKFFRNGLNSAIDMGNEAYSAPEVLTRGSQRNQCSDVWAMGKIIAELCARIRLHTPSVCPAKIKETLRDSPYCNAVCRMVESDPSLRASMGGIISDIRRAGGGGTVVQPPPRIQLNAPTYAETRDRSPAPKLKSPPSTNYSPFPMNKSPTPMNRSPLLMNKSPTPMNRSPLLMNKSPTPKNPSPALLNRNPKPEALHPITAPHRSPSPHPLEDMTKKQALVPATATGLNEDLMKMALYKEASKDVPGGLPMTGTVRVRRFEEKDGGVETWTQKEVVTQGGKIIKFDDVTFDYKK